jgi:mutator protein MutT
LPNASEPSSTAATDTAVAVVAAVIEAAGRILITRRQRGTHLEGLWEFPGGKVDAGETHDAALKREIREELDADVDVHELVLSTTHRYPARAVALSFYRCTLTSEPRPILGQEMRWVARDELGNLEFPEADNQLIALLVGRPDGLD